MTDVGMNLAPVKYFGTEFPFIDRMKTSETWVSSGGTTVPVDEHGNPTAIPTGSSLIYTVVGLDPTSAPMTDTYELTWSGTGTFQVPGTTTISSSPGKLVFKYTVPNSTIQSVIIRSIDSKDPVHDIHLVRQDQVSDFQHGEIFNSDFLAQVSNWSVLRFMDWEATNGTTISSWDDRTHVGDLSWAQNGNSSGVPIEVMIQLANEAKTDLWFNVPTQADDNYVRNALELIKDRLAPGLKVHVEYSNEVWNPQFQQTKYAQTMANQLWGVDANKNGTIDATEAVAGGNQVYYGYRSAQIASIANSVFSGADDSRLEMVLATQTGNNTLEKYWIDGIAKANAGSIASLFDELAGADYFGMELSGYTAADQAKVLGWAKSGEAGLAAAFDELAHGGAGLSVTLSVDAVAPYLKYEAGVAARYGLDFVAYEGGFHGSALYYGDNQATIIDFFARLMADPRMQDLYQYWFDAFKNAGGTMMAAFNDVQQPNAGGSFGTLNSLYDTKTERYQALLANAAPKDMSDHQVDFSDILAELFPHIPNIPLADSVVAVPKVANDFNGDGRSDILWRSSGQMGNWFANAGSGFTANATLSSVSSDWKIVGTGDFNGDGRADILWRNADGRLGDWLADSTGNFTPNATLTQVGNEWQVVGTGDFNGDGKVDLLWRNAGGSIGTWSSDANGNFTPNAALYPVGNDWTVAGTGDFNGDGRADILWRNTGTGQLGDWFADSTGKFTPNATMSSAPLNWHIVETGDFNGDGRTDILWRSDAGQLGDWLADANGNFTPNATLYGAPLDWKVAETGDYNGDGRTDILWRNSDTGQIGVWTADANGNFTPDPALLGADKAWAIFSDHAFLV